MRPIATKTRYQLNNKIVEMILNGNRVNASMNVCILLFLNQTMQAKQNNKKAGFRQFSDGPKK
jgi:hypothetical protein